MLHLLLYGLLAILLAGLLFAAAARFLPAGEQIAPPVRDEPPWDLPPDRPLSADEVDAVRLPVALRGYRFAETDLLLDRLAGELRSRDEELARLRGDLRTTDAAEELAAGEDISVDEADAAVAGEAQGGAVPVPAERLAVVGGSAADDQLADELAVEEALGEEPAGPSADPVGDVVPAEESEAVPEKPVQDVARAAEPNSAPAGATAAAIALNRATASAAARNRATESPVADPARPWAASAPPWAVARAPGFTPVAHAQPATEQLPEPPAEQLAEPPAEPPAGPPAEPHAEPPAEQLAEPPAQPHLGDNERGGVLARRWRRRRG